MFTKSELPLTLNNMFTLNRNIHAMNTRHRNDPHIMRRRTEKASKSLIHKGPELWYQLPEHIKQSDTRVSFIKLLKEYLLGNYES